MESCSSDFQDIKIEEENIFKNETKKEERKPSSSDFQDIKIEQEKMKCEILTFKKEIYFVEDNFWSDKKVDCDGSSFCSFREEDFPKSKTNDSLISRTSNNDNYDADKMNIESENDKHVGEESSLNDGNYLHKKVKKMSFQCDACECYFDIKDHGKEKPFKCAECLDDRRPRPLRRRSLSPDRICKVLEDCSDIEISDEEADTTNETYAPRVPNDKEQSSSEESSETEIVQYPETETATKNAVRKRRRLTVWRKKNFNPPNSQWKDPEGIESDDGEITSAMPTPYELFKNYIPDSLIELMSENTNIYSAKTLGTSLDTNPQEIEMLIGMHVKMGILKYPRVKMYWSNIGGTRNELIATAMTAKRFFKLRNHLHLVDNDSRPENEDRLWKVRPIFEYVRNRCIQLPKQENYSIDEMMIPLSGKLNIKQCMKGKPNPWGIKVFVLCTSKGLVTDFLPYQGKTTEIDEKYKDFSGGLGGSIVLHLCRLLPEGHNFKVAFDKFFTSLSLIRELKSRQIFSVGTIRNNRTEQCPLLPETELKKKGQGSNDYRVDLNEDVVVVKWYDNKAIYLASSYLAIGREIEVERWKKKEKQYIPVKMPEIVQTYNDNMGGVDQMDQLIAYYRIFIRSRKWTLRVIFHMIDLAICNSWLEHRRLIIQHKVGKIDQYDLLKFRDIVGEALMKANKFVTPQIKERSGTEERIRSPHNSKIAPMHRPGVASRFDKIDHMPKFLDQKNSSRCAYEPCSKKTFFYCMKCNVPLCITRKKNCFFDFHNKKN